MGVRTCPHTRSGSPSAAAAPGLRSSRARASRPPSPPPTRPEVARRQAKDGRCAPAGFSFSRGYEPLEVEAKPLHRFLCDTGLSGGAWLHIPAGSGGGGGGGFAAAAADGFYPALTCGSRAPVNAVAVLAGGGGGGGGGAATVAAAQDDGTLSLFTA